jgi:hypothetical protein
VKFQGAIGGGVDVRSVSPAGNVCGADEQWLVAKSVRDFYPDFLSACASVRDEAEGLVVKGLDAPLEGGLRGSCPRSNPMILRDVWERKTKQQEKREGAVP